MIKYECVREFKSPKIEINVWKIEFCFKVKPLNNVVYPGMKISKMTILQPEYAKVVINKKTKRKLDLYLTFLSTLEEDSDGSEDAAFVLDDLNKFKETIIIKYSKYLSKSELAKLLKQLSFIESKLKIRAYSYDSQIGFGKNR